MKSYTSTLLLILLYFFFCTKANAQARLILNGANITISNGAYLVLENDAPDAITRNSGQIISEGENNRIKWMIGEMAGSYLIPWGFGATDYFPLSFTKTAGTGNGNFLFSTYRTGWQNSLSLPTGITSVSGGSTDNSAILIDRFWQVNAQGYSIKPTFTNTKFSYIDVEHTVPDNKIIESALLAQRWNDMSNTWNDLLATGIDDPSANTVTVSTISSENLYSWWTLIAPNVVLPLNFLTFEAKKINTKAQLLWTTASEINVKEFEVQRCTDGYNFFTIARVPAKNNNFNSYETYDNLTTGKILYRIKEVDFDGSFSYSEIRAITLKNFDILLVYPNPTFNKNLYLDTKGIPEGKYHLSIFSIDGKLVFSSLEFFKQNIVAFELDRQIQKGIYTMKVEGRDALYIKKILVK